MSSNAASDSQPSPVSLNFPPVNQPLQARNANPYLLRTDNYLTWVRALKSDAIAKGYMKYYESAAEPIAPSFGTYTSFSWKPEDPKTSDKEQLAVMDENLAALKAHHDKFMVSMRSYRDEKSRRLQAIKYLRNRLDKGVLDEFDSVKYKSPHDAFKSLKRFDIDQKHRHQVAKHELQRLSWDHDTQSHWFIGEMLRIQANVREYNPSESSNMYADMVKHLLAQLPREKYSYIQARQEVFTKKQDPKHAFDALVNTINLIEGGVSADEINLPGVGKKGR
ncbi:hypothetical protein PV10_01160 [Exophiala mesophila]|uniref:Uncharacterized protein n=1 Tax=Exophiala mesophila TaxID=212818 RepID=A0A0D1X6F1_EXOME|nr:uncharacterized protein PV10_01160 [Exophiala mesophila]KIV97405.1 hypothetical protein PV10_01160 [Exophiala mesophila]